MKATFNNLDKILEKTTNQLIVIENEANIDKTDSLAKLIKNIIFKRNIPTLLFSLELSKESIANQILANELMVSIEDLEKKNFTTDQWSSFGKLCKEIANYELYIGNTPEISIEELKIKCNEMKQEHDIAIAIIDCFKPSKNNSVKKLENLAKELGVVIIAVIYNNE